MLLYFRSTPCSLVKSDEEWGELSACEAGENCVSSHTRTEQQFHPEVGDSLANYIGHSLCVCVCVCVCVISSSL